MFSPNLVQEFEEVHQQLLEAINQHQLTGVCVIDKLEQHATAMYLYGDGRWVYRLMNIGFDINNDLERLVRHTAAVISQHPSERLSFSQLADHFLDELVTHMRRALEQVNAVEA